LEELAQQSTVTKAEARAERRAALGKRLDPADARLHTVDSSVSVHVTTSFSLLIFIGYLHFTILIFQQVVVASQVQSSSSKMQPAFSKPSPRNVSFNSRSPDYEELENSMRSPEPSSNFLRYPASQNLVSNESSSAHRKPMESSNSFAGARSSPGIAAPATFSFNASAAPGDPVSQALLKKLFAIEQSVSLLQAQIVKCLASDDASVYDQLHNSNIQVEKLMRIRSEILVALQHQQQMAATSPTVTGASSSHFTPSKPNSLSPLGHSSKVKEPPVQMEHGYMSDNASSATFSASSRTNGDQSSSVSHSVLSSSEDM
jgi:hypothetical protein